MLIVSICSAKGGVGKSFVTSLIARNLKLLGIKVGVLDADIYGPCQHTNFDSKSSSPKVINDRFVPSVHDGIKFLSAAMMINDTDINLIRGPLISSILDQVFNNTDWGNIEILLIDMPPGTGDSYLTIFQSGLINAAIIVTSSSKLSLIQSVKTFDLCKRFKVQVAGFIENFSDLRFPDSLDAKEYIADSIGSQKKVISSIPLISDTEYVLPDIHNIFTILKSFNQQIETKNLY